jgi:hypothetical protein
MTSAAGMNFGDLTAPPELCLADERQLAVSIAPQFGFFNGYARRFMRMLKVFPWDRCNYSVLQTLSPEEFLMLEKTFMATLISVVIVLSNASNLFAQSEGPTRSVNFGPNAKNFGIVGVTKDFLLNDHFSLFVTGGLTSPFIGGGAAYYVKSYHKSSFVFSSTIGAVGAQANAAYQWKAGKRGFVTTGVSYGLYALEYDGFVPLISYEIRF